MFKSHGGYVRDIQGGVHYLMDLSPRAAWEILSESDWVTNDEWEQYPGDASFLRNGGLYNKDFCLVEMSFSAEKVVIIDNHDGSYRLFIADISAILTWIEEEVALKRDAESPRGLQLRAIQDDIRARFC